VRNPALSRSLARPAARLATPMLATAAAMMSALAPSQAGAASVRTEGHSYDPIYGGGPKLVYRAGGGEANDLDVRVMDDRYVVADPGARIEAIEPCVVLDAERHRASCPASPSPWAEIGLGDGDDRALVGLPAGPKSSPPRVRVAGGPGADILRGGASIDALSGDDGDDTLLGAEARDELYGGAGADLLDGGPDDLPHHRIFDGGGSDRLDGGPGADVIRGGPGVGDWVSYAERTLPLLITLGDARPDGELGEGDLIENDVEAVTGGSGHDTLIGDAGTNALEGGGGDDRLAGGGGTHDVLYGGAGSDVLDALDGGAEARGTPAFGPGTGIYDDVFDCDAGPPGASPGDLALVDRGDSGAQSRSVGGCETVMFSDRPVTISPEAPVVTVPGGCPARFDCSGTVLLRVPRRRSASPAGSRARVFEPPARWRTVARGRFRGRAGKRARVRVTLSRRARRSLGRRRTRAYATFSLRAVLR
jgi:RTX calcium-binding nonapeptide repeat (4 copies)